METGYGHAGAHGLLQSDPAAFAGSRLCVSIESANAVFFEEISRKKVFSLVLSLLCVLLAITIIVLIVSPQIVDNIKSLVMRFPTDMESAESLIREIMDYFNISSDVQETLIQNLNV